MPSIRRSFQAVQEALGESPGSSTPPDTAA
jgi:hypothetical protein